MKEHFSKARRLRLTALVVGGLISAGLSIVKGQSPAK